MSKYDGLTENEVRILLHDKLDDVRSSLVSISMDFNVRNSSLDRLDGVLADMGQLTAALRKFPAAEE